jgi:glutamate 5-kinase
MQYSITNGKRIVIKIGSSLLVDNETNRIRMEWLMSFLEEIADYWQQQKQIIIVSSGAIPLGKCQLQIKERALQLKEKQAAAAVGQIKLAEAYQTVLGDFGITSAQVLLTLDDFKNSERCLNAENTLETLLNFRTIPVINENDTVATSEIQFGDNDNLAAHVAKLIKADILVLLSDINGLYTANPQIDDEAKLISLVNELTPEIMAMGHDSTTQYGSGGMKTKLAAAKIAMSFGCKMVIACGKHFYPLKCIAESRENTWFVPTNAFVKENLI